MNIVDALVVTLNLNADGFKKGNKEVQDGIKKTGDEAEKLRKKHEEEAKKSAEAFKTVSNAVMGITAAIVSAVAGGAFLAFLKNNDAAAMNLARNINSTTQEVSALEGVFRRMGSNTESAEGFLRTVNKIQQELRLTGTSGALQPFVMAGLDVGAFRKAGPQQAMDLLADSASKMDASRAQYYLQQAGMSEDQITLILRGRAAIDEMFKSQQRLNVATEESGLQDRKRKQAWADLGEAMAGTGRVIADFVTPVLVGALHAMTNFIVWIRDNVPGAVAILGTLTAGLLLLKGYSITTMASAFSGNIAVMGTAVGGLIGKMGILVATFTAAYEAGTALNNMFNLDDKISDLFVPEFNPKFATGDTTGMSILTGKGRSGGGSSGNFGSLEQKWGLPSGLLDQVWRQESGRGKNMRSKAGAKGHFQFMDATAAQYGLKDPDDLASSSDAAGHYLHDLLAMYGGDLSKALAAYNEGPGNVNKGRMPAETANYVSGIRSGMSVAQSRGGSGGGATVTVGNVTIQTSAATMTGAGHDLGKGLHGAILTAQANVGVQ